MKEIEVKIFDISPKKMKQQLKAQGAEFVKRVFQRNILYQTAYTEKNNVVVRLRYEKNDATFTIKTNKRIVRGHKVQNELEMMVDGPMMERMLTSLGFTVQTIAEMKRDYYLLRGCSVEICQLPRIPAYLEIEGDERSIARVAKVLGYTKNDYAHESARQRYGVTSRRWVFGK